MVEIKEVKSARENRLFISFADKLYKRSPYYVPAFKSDEYADWSPRKNPAYAYSEVRRFLAYRDGKPVGRVAAILSRRANEKWGENRMRFSALDFIDDSEVSSALMHAVEDFAREKGCEAVHGPLGFTDLDREGLLIEGFEHLSTFEEQYNYDYYADLIEACGYAKEIDWLEFRLRAPKEKNVMLARVAERAMELNGLHVVDHTTMSKKAYIDRYKDGVFDCIDRCYRHLYGTVPFTEEMKAQIVDQFMTVINKKYLVVICDKDDLVVSFALCIPGIGKAVQKSGGRLTPAALVRLLRAVKHPETVDLALVAILPEYQSAGVNAVMLHKMTEYLESGEIDYFETNLNLETNTQVMAQWKYFDSEQHKRRRSYKKTLGNTAEPDKR